MYAKRAFKKSVYPGFQTDKSMRQLRQSAFTCVYIRSPDEQYLTTEVKVIFAVVK